MASLRLNKINQLPKFRITDILDADGIRTLQEILNEKIDKSIANDDNGDILGSFNLRYDTNSNIIMDSVSIDVNTKERTVSSVNLTDLSNPNSMLATSSKPGFMTKEQVVRITTLEKIVDRLTSFGQIKGSVEYNSDLYESDSPALAINNHEGDIYLVRKDTTDEHLGERSLYIVVVKNGVNEWEYLAEYSQILDARLVEFEHLEETNLLYNVTNVEDAINILDSYKQPVVPDTATVGSYFAGTREGADKIATWTAVNGPMRYYETDISSQIAENNSTNPSSAHMYDLSNITGLINGDFNSARFFCLYYNGIKLVENVHYKINSNHINMYLGAGFDSEENPQIGESMVVTYWVSPFWAF